MITRQHLGGIQLLADGEWKAKIMTDFAVTSIPAFILIGPDGNIIDSTAPRPSDSKLDRMLRKLDL